MMVYDRYRLLLWKTAKLNIEPEGRIFRKALTYFNLLSFNKANDKHIVQKSLWNQGRPYINFGNRYFIPISHNL